jgi:hypothetical protein
MDAVMNSIPLIMALLFGSAAVYELEHFHSYCNVGVECLNHA